jgi:crotonobetainyl-CoA:carnitine CoA-transferase CaiB-like acyl-CoA transferase
MHKKAYDLLIQAESGVISTTGSPEQPSRVGLSMADIATGMYALTGVLGALLRRATTGQGGNVQVAMLDAVGEWMTPAMLRHAYFGSPPPRMPTSHPMLAPYGAHKTKDGQIIIGLQNEREWVTFCDKVLNDQDVRFDPRFATQPMRTINRDALTAVIEAHFASMTSVEVAAMLDRAGIANGRLNQPIDAWNHEQFAARDKWREVMTETGPVRALLPPFTYPEEEAVMADVPALGQHTDAVLSEIGFSGDRIAAMRAAGAI